jgi:hypothetical protein
MWRGSDDCVGGFLLRMGGREGGKWKLKRASSIVFCGTPQSPTERFRAVRSNALRGFRNMKPFGASDECAVGLHAVGVL